MQDISNHINTEDSKKRILSALQKYNEGMSAITPIREEAIKIGMRVYRAKGNNTKACNDAFPHWYEHNVYITSDNITIEWNEYHCGDTDHYDLVFPLRYLWEDDFEEQARQEEEKERKERKERMQARQDKLEATKKEQRRQEYEKLKQEFE